MAKENITEDINDNTMFTINNEEIDEHRIYEPPKRSDWEYCLSGDWYAITVNPVKVPNRFYRFMLRLVFDIHWRKKDS